MTIKSCVTFKTHIKILKIKMHTHLLSKCEKKKKRKKNIQYKRLIGWLVGFYGISTLIGYLMPNTVYTYIEYK